MCCTAPATSTTATREPGTTPRFKPITAFVRLRAADGCNHLIALYLPSLFFAISALLNRARASASRVEDGGRALVRSYVRPRECVRRIHQTRPSGRRNKLGWVAK